MPKISSLPPAIDPDGNDPYPIVDESAGITRKLTLSQLSAWLQSLFINLIEAGVLLSTYRKETTFDHIASGCVLTGTGYGSTLNWSLTAGVVYINGKRLTVAAVTGAATASRNTYFDLLDPATGTIATLVNTGGNIVTTNAASPALAANSVRLAILVSGANILNLGSVNQGEENKVLPIATSIPYMVTDSLGNLICPRDPSRKILGYREIRSTFTLSATQTTPTQITGLTCPVIIPTGRKVEIDIFNRDTFNALATNSTQLTIWDGAVNVGAQLQNGFVPAVNGAAAAAGVVSYMGTPSEGPKTFNAGVQSGGLTNVTFECAGSAPGFIRVRLA